MNFYKYLLILFICFKGYTQRSGEVTYAVKVKVNDSIPSEKTPWQKSVQKLADVVDFKLLFTEDLAYFEILKDKQYEQVMHAFQEYHPRIKSSTYLPALYFKYEGQIWQKTRTNYCFIPRKMFIDNCIRKEPMLNDWEVTNETQEILGYTCKKAILKTSFFHKDKMKKYKVQVFAWFTKEIPYSYGPNNYNGLPGLVLKYEDIYFDYIAKKITFNKVEIPNVPDNYPIYTSEEYRELWEKEMNNN